MEKQSKLRFFIREEIKRLNEADEKGLNVGDIQRLVKKTADKYKLGNVKVTKILKHELGKSDRFQVSIEDWKNLVSDPKNLHLNFFKFLEELDELTKKILKADNYYLIISAFPKRPNPSALVSYLKQNKGLLTLGAAQSISGFNLNDGDDSSEGDYDKKYSADNIKNIIGGIASVLKTASTDSLNKFKTKADDEYYEFADILIKVEKQIKDFAKYLK